MTLLLMNTPRVLFNLASPSMRSQGALYILRIGGFDTRSARQGVKKP